MIAIDLPGFGDTPPLARPLSIAALADAVSSFPDEHGLVDTDLVGSSMGARLVLELARRGAGGSIVALSPGGFWTPAQLGYFQISIGVSIRVVRLLQPVLPAMLGNPAGRTGLLAQFSAHPWRVPAQVALDELRAYAASPSFDATLHELVHGPTQGGSDSTAARVTIGWGRQDRVCLTSQAQTAQRRFPRADLTWFDGCGHFPHWNAPRPTARLILDRTG